MPPRPRLATRGREPARGPVCGRGQLISGPTTWLHVRVARKGALPQLPHASLGGTPVRALVQWLLYHGPSYRCELRLCGSGSHGGVWVGLTGRGATSRHARLLTEQGAAELSALVRASSWRARPRPAPRLPAWRVGLQFRADRPLLTTDRVFLAQRALVDGLADHRAPWVLQVRLTPGAPGVQLIDEAERLASGLGPGSEVRRLRSHPPVIRERLSRVADAAADLTATVHLACARPPSDIRLRMLACTFPGTRVARPWGPTATPTRASLRVLRSAVALLAGKEAP